MASHWTISEREKRKEKKSDRRIYFYLRKNYMCDDLSQKTFSHFIHDNNSCCATGNWVMLWVSEAVYGCVSECKLFDSIKLRPFRWISFRWKEAYRDHEIESMGKMFVIIAMQCVLWINIWNSQRNTEIHVAEHIKSKCWIANEYCWTFPFYQQFVVTCAYYSKVSNTTLHDKDKQQQTDIREKLIKLFERSPRMLL